MTSAGSPLAKAKAKVSGLAEILREGEGGKESWSHGKLGKHPSALEVADTRIEVECPISLAGPPRQRGGNLPLLVWVTPKPHRLFEGTSPALLRCSHAAGLQEACLFFPVLP